MVLLMFTRADSLYTRYFGCDVVGIYLHEGMDGTEDGWFKGRTNRGHISKGRAGDEVLSWGLVMCICCGRGDGRV